MPDTEPFHFDETFRVLTEHDPLPWQRRFYRRLMAGDWPDAVDLPTGLGKTSVIVLWMIALANGGPVPRRLVVVVNRRTIIDQQSDVVRRLVDRLDAVDGLRERLAALGGYGAGEAEEAGEAEPLAVSTLRGELADNEAWFDTAKPAVVLATPDLAGSGLLFGHYRSSFKRHNFYAGLLGHDVLLLHDEAHLTA
ncbi:MAG: DEAD/DEAH box helicase family protein, partial [Planctomycetota bacterium]